MTTEFPPTTPSAPLPRKSSTLVPPSKLRDPKPVRTLDKYKVGYAASMVFTGLGLGLLTVFLSWKIALAVMLLELGFVAFVFVEVASALDR